MKTESSTRRLFLNAAAATACSTWGAPFALAQPARAFPNKAITLVVPSAAGGGLDIAMRPVARRLSDTLGVPVVVENRPGVNLLIGTRYVAGAPPDGYTLLAIANTFLGAPIFAEAAGYDPFRDFVAIAPTAEGANLLLVSAASQITSASDLIARGKSAGADKLTFGTAGIGSSPHIAADLLSVSTGTEFTAVPYKGTAPAMIDLIGGRITFMFDSITAAVQHVKAGTLRALAVTTSRRSTLLPEVPTMAEALKLADYNLPLFYGIAVPARTPPEVVRVLHGAIAKVVADPTLREQYAGMGIEIPASRSPDDYTAFLRQQFEKFKSLKN